MSISKPVKSNKGVYIAITKTRLVPETENESLPLEAVRSTRKYLEGWGRERISKKKEGDEETKNGDHRKVSLS